jgi:two-component system, OmpR family, response regulator AdeR
MTPSNNLILIVEDELEIAEVLEAYLRREGWRTERALDGQRALDLYRATKPDLILLDIQMPILDGLEVLRRVRSDGTTPVIMLTARAEDIDKLIGLELGADDYVRSWQGSKRSCGGSIRKLPMSYGLVRSSWTRKR